MDDEDNFQCLKVSIKGRVVVGGGAEEQPKMIPPAGT